MDEYVGLEDLFRVIDNCLVKVWYMLLNLMKRIFLMGEVFLLDYFIMVLILLGVLISVMFVLWLVNKLIVIMSGIVFMVFFIVIGLRIFMLWMLRIMLLLLVIMFWWYFGWLFSFISWCVIVLCVIGIIFIGSGNLFRILICLEVFVI